MAVWSKVSHWHEMICHDPEVMGSKSGAVKLGGYIVILSKSNLSQNTNYHILNLKLDTKGFVNIQLTLTLPLAEKLSVKNQLL